MSVCCQSFPGAIGAGSASALAPFITGRGSQAWARLGLFNGSAALAGAREASRPRMTTR